MNSVSATASRSAHLLGIEDAKRIIAIDRAHTGRTRRQFFEHRLAAARARPNDFIHVGVSRSGVLRGFAIARILRGEFGRKRAVAVLDAVGVEPQSQELGVGQALIEALVDAMRQKGVASLQSQVDWKNRDLLHFFAASGFELAPRVALERSVVEPLYETSDDV
jgi:GNAT superfamily N-acetyltransferase